MLIGRRNSAIAVGISHGWRYNDRTTWPHPYTLWEQTMRAKDTHRQQKRQAKLAKLAKRARKERSSKSAASTPTPYSGRKYQTDRWAPHVYQTELAIYETIALSGRRLTNAHVKLALAQLINDLRRGVPPAQQDGEPEVPFIAGQEVEFLVWNIRRHWRQLFEDEGPVSRDDLVGILRTLLHSIEAHAWNTGPHRGYVDYLVSFLGRAHGGPPAEYFGG
jgi:hypothetical protein